MTSSADDVLFFDVLAKSASLTQAARELGLSVSSVSKRLAGIERRLNVRLIERTTRRLTLTPEGERYAAGAATITNGLIELEDSIAQRGELAGRIRVHASLGLGRHHIGPLVAEFLEQHPRVQLELELSPLPLNIPETTFDLGVHVGRVHDSLLAIRRLGLNRRVVCASPNYLARHGTPHHLKDLQQHNCIVLRQDEGDFALWRFGTDNDQTAVKVSGNLACNDGEVTTQWCIEGRGLIMRSSWHVGPLLQEGVLVQVLPHIPTPSADVYAVYSADARLPRRVRELIAHLAGGLGPRIGSVPDS
ncbi:LysR family transcriptional regulator [Mycobacterium sp. HNNTM2301]|uniref:LysR family transcriptional regulator n=1 Tax=Mycobacterium hainanense TaxID=3289775 RepID=UPI0035A65217